MDDLIKETEAEAIRILLGRGIGFRLGRRLLRLYDQPLGGEMLLQQEIRELGLSKARLLNNPVGEMRRVWDERRKSSLRVIVRATLWGRKEHLDEEFIGTQLSLLEDELDDESGPILLSAVLQKRGSGKLIDLLGLREEQEEQRRIGELRGDESGMLSFGGRSVFGRLIDRACERYGWTYDYTVWGVSLPALEMMLTDQISGIYVNEEERRKLGLRGIGEIDGESANIEELMRLTNE